MRRFARAALVLALALVAVGPLAPSGTAGAATPITGGGSSFAALAIDHWKASVARDPLNLQVNYVSQGSTFGRVGFSEGQLDYAASDIIYQDAEKGTLQSRRCGGRPPDAGCFVYVPVSAGGLAFMYNLIDNTGHRITDLKLTRRAACKVFTGAITRWNDPEIVGSNPQLAGFARDIVPVIRSDGAGESYVFSQFCIAVAPDVWNGFRDRQIRDHPESVATDFRNGAAVSNWPQEWGRSVSIPLADGVATNVADDGTGANHITYVAAGYAKVKQTPMASLQNAAGVYTQPDETNVTVALGYATGRGDGTFNLNFTGPDPRAYFPSTYSYVLAQTTGFDQGKGETLGKFLCWAVSAGQDADYVDELKYARLSKPIVDIAIDAISKIPGAPPKSSCFVAGAAAPPPPPGLIGQTGGPGTGGPSAAEQAAAQQAAAAQKAAEAAARKARLAEERQQNLDRQLGNTASVHPSDSLGPIWLMLIGAGLAAIAVAVLGARRKAATCPRGSAPGRAARSRCSWCSPRSTPRWRRGRSPGGPRTTPRSCGCAARARGARTASCSRGRTRWPGRRLRSISRTPHTARCSAKRASSAAISTTSSPPCRSRPRTRPRFPAGAG